MKKTVILFTIYLLFPLALHAQSQFPQYLFCLSWMGLDTQLHEKKLDEYAMAEINHTHKDWSFQANVMENRLNSLKLTQVKEGVSTQSYSTHFPFNHLAVRLEVKNQLATLDCELRHESTLE
ncbi:MAG: hypothetical protein ACK5V3_12390 [Bdellovibrionales bacterium]